MLNFPRFITCCLALVAIANTAQAAESIAYRLTATKEMHFDDARKAELHLATVRKLGCTARMDSHGGHTDVIYESSPWQSLEVANDELAHQWEDWLKKAGFETIHGHTADHDSGHDASDGHDHAGHSHAGHGHGDMEEVAYQLRQWKTIHIEDERELTELVALLKGLGCEVRSEGHSDHTDLSIRCASWRHIEFDTHRAAASWEAWLKQNGFVTRHEH